MQMMANRRVVITGMGLVTALGESLPVFWENICAGRSGIKKIEGFDTTAYPVRIGGEICHFDPTNYIDKREAKRIDRFALFALASAISAVKDSGLDMERIDIGLGVNGEGSNSELFAGADDAQRDFTAVCD